jgi:uncharacterized protein YggU (UPF0235/DUF167 family)
MSRVAVRVTARANRDRVDGFVDDVLRLRVAAAPVDGQANEAIERLLASALGIARARVWVVRGASSRDKIVEIEGLSVEEIRARVG